MDLHESDEDLKAFYLKKLDLFAYLRVWGAPWVRCRLDINMMEKFWTIEEINDMVEERAAHPDYKYADIISYPKDGWIEDLLTKTKLSLSDSSTISMLVISMIQAHDYPMIEPTALDESQKEDILKQEQLYREAIQSFPKYMPEGLDEMGEQFHRRHLDNLEEMLTVGLAALLMTHGRDKEALEIYPDLLAGAEFTSEVVVEAVELAVDKIKYYGDDTALGGMPESVADDENELNPKHLIKTGYHEVFMEKKYASGTKKLDMVLEMLDRFVDQDSGDLIESALEQAVEKLVSTTYKDYFSYFDIGLAAEQLYNMEKYELAREYYLLNRAANQVVETPSKPGYSKDTDELLWKKAIGLAELGMGRFSDSHKSLLDAIEIAEKYAEPKDVTGRKVSQQVQLNLKIHFWLLMHNWGRDSDAESVWSEICGHKSFDYEVKSFADCELIYGKFVFLAPVERQYFRWLKENGKDDVIADFVKQQKSTMSRTSRLFVPKSESDISGATGGIYPLFLGYLEDNGFKDVYQVFENN